jgi:7-cyano-7-deazaguanine reductase
MPKSESGISAGSFRWGRTCGSGGASSVFRRRGERRLLGSAFLDMARVLYSTLPLPATAHPSAGWRRTRFPVRRAARMARRMKADLAPRKVTEPGKSLATFPNPSPARDYEIRFECPEFTCLCPMTGQPDFATIKIAYVPDRSCVELKSLKLYLWSYRNEGAFHEAVTNRILDDLVEALKPRRCEVVGDFFVRGGIHTVVVARYPDR